MKIHRKGPRTSIRVLWNRLKRSADSLILHIRSSSSLLCDCLKQLEFLSIHSRIQDRNDDAFKQAFETQARVHRRGNLDMRLLFVLYGGHRKGSHDVLNRVDILLDQDPAWFWLADTLVKGLLYS
jgi:hypothetical protein